MTMYMTALGAVVVFMVLAHLSAEI